jgi:hypothetical protein
VARPDTWEATDTIMVDTSLKGAMALREKIVLEWLGQTLGK